MQERVLIVEDDADIGQLVVVNLRAEGYAVDLRVRGDGALSGYRQVRPDLVILDLMLPGMGGLDVCRALRAESEHVPILMLTAKSTELDRVLGLELGADDYLTKPFGIRELVARVNALLRRARTSRGGRAGRLPVQAGDLTIDPEKRSVRRAGETLCLTAKEFDLLLEFASNPGRAYSRTQLLDRVWGYTNGNYEHTVNTHINRLRAKIEPDPSAPRLILTVWGIGYKFAERPAGV